MEGDIGVTRGTINCGPQGYTILVFLCIALYNVIELTFILWGYFKRHSGLYFWSFNIATYGIGIYALGFLFKAVLPESGTYAYITLVAIGWVSMILGQSLVLWSRLHLVLRDNLKLRLVLWGIIINSTCMFVPILVFLYGANSTNPGRFVGAYGIYENIQVSMFFAQELILSSIYIWETVKLARLHSELRLAWRSRRLMIHLIAVNVGIILLDIGILGLEYATLYGVQTAYKGFVYSLKLKMEFTILSRLKEMTTGQKDPSSDPHSITDSTQRGPHRYPSSGTVPSGGIYPYNSPIWEPSGMIRRPPPISYHAYVQGRDNCRPLARWEGDGNSSEVDIVMTTEVTVRREDIPPHISADDILHHRSSSSGVDSRHVNPIPDRTSGSKAPSIEREPT